MKLTEFFAGLAVVAAARAAPSEGTAKRQGGLQFTGVNVAGGEFGNMNLPGELNTDYVWPDKTALDTLFNDGMNTFRVGMMMLVPRVPASWLKGRLLTCDRERAIPDQMTGTINETYFEGFEDVSRLSPCVTVW